MYKCDKHGGTHMYNRCPDCVNETITITTTNNLPYPITWKYEDPDKTINDKLDYIIEKLNQIEKQLDKTDK